MDRLQTIFQEGLNQVAREGDLSRWLGRLLSHACERTGACRGHVFAYREPSDQLETVACWLPGQLLSGSARDDARVLQKPFSAHINGNFHAMCRNQKLVFLEPAVFLHKVWPGTRSWHRRMGHRCAAAVPLVAAGRPLGELALLFDRPLTRAQLLEDEVCFLANQAALSLLINQLLEGERAQLLSQERERLAREIHDGIAQNLVGIILQLRAHGELDSLPLQRIELLARQALQEARRSLEALRPPLLEGLGFAEALRELLRHGLLIDGIVSTFRMRGSLRPLPPHWEHEIFRIVQEGLANISRHSQASRVSLRVDFAATEFRLALSDNGIGLSDRPSGYGLRGIFERAARLGGSVQLRALRPGTRLALRLPWKELPQ